MSILRRIKTKLSILTELMEFLWKGKLYWLIPLVLVLVFFGVFFVFAQATGLAPFVYTLF